MSLTQNQIRVMQLIDQERVYWNRQGGSWEYASNVQIVRHLVSQGYVLCVNDGCCTKDFMLTAEGKNELEHSIH